MLIDHIRCAGAYTGMGSGLAQALSFLASAPLATLAPGRHAIAGDRVFALDRRVYHPRYLDEPPQEAADVGKSSSNGADAEPDEANGTADPDSRPRRRIEDDQAYQRLL